ncbi:MAG: protein kinase, partial [bacterium]
GVVYQAKDTKLERDVAIKFLPDRIAANETERERFKREAKAAAALNHPNIATIHAIEETDDELYIVMEYIDGQDLKSANSEQFPVNSVINFALQIAEGLQAAHDSGIIHRDIKTTNIMLTSDGRVKIMDFGLAKFAREADLQLTKSGTTLGTVPYMSPEQLRGETIDFRSDLWAFGVVLYEILTGQLPFTGEYEQAVMYSILSEEPQPMGNFRTDIPQTLQAFVERCLQKNPDNRYASTAELRADLQNVQKQPDHRDIRTISKDARIQAKSAHRFANYGLAAATLLLLIFTLAYFENVKSWLGFETFPKEKRIVVLPFSNITGGQQNQAFCNGLIEVLTSKLTQIEQFQGALLVIPSSEVQQLEIASASQAFEHFRANLVISGSVQRTEADIRLTINLIDAENLRQIDSEIITEKMKGVTDFQDNVVTRLADLLQLNLQPEIRSLLAAGHTTAPGAFDFYLQGRGYLQDYDKLENIDMAITLFEQALEKDSLYALAYAGLGEAYWRKRDATKENHWIALTVENCQRALALNDLLAPAHITLGIVYKGTGKYNEAEEEFKRALEIDPANADAFRELANAYAKLNKADEVEKTYLKAITLKPGYWANYYDLGRFYQRRGEYQKAEEQYLAVIKLSPRHYRAYRNLCALYIALDRYSEAERMGKYSVEIQPNYGGYANLGLILFTQQKYGEAATMYEKALAINDRYYANWGNLASCYAQIPTKQNQAAGAYQRAIEQARLQLDVNPNNSTVLQRLSKYYSEIDAPAEASNFLERALALAPKDIDLLYNAATIKLKLNKKEDALNFLEKAMQLGYSIKKIEQSPSLENLKSDQR